MTAPCFYAQTDIMGYSLLAGKPERDNKRTNRTRALSLVCRILRSRTLVLPYLEPDCKSSQARAHYAAKRRKVAETLAVRLARICLDEIVRHHHTHFPSVTDPYIMFLWVVAKFLATGSGALEYEVRSEVCLLCVVSPQ